MCIAALSPTNSPPTRSFDFAQDDGRDVVMKNESGNARGWGAPAPSRSAFGALAGFISNEEPESVTKESRVARGARALPRVRQRGFTLLEIILAVAILGMMALAIYRFVQTNITAVRVAAETSVADSRYD